jgi:predicted nucleic acid-binding protein
VIVVSNTSPIINLAAIDRLDLLRQLYGGILIPQSVRNEIVRSGTSEPGASEVEMFDWIETRNVANQTAVSALRLELDAGEAETIILGIELKADLVLLDERKARMAASRLNLKFVGLLGILVEAKHKGIVDEVKPVMDNLMTKAGFWIAPELYKRVLQTVGE